MNLYINRSFTFLVILFIRGYQRFLSPFFAPACRFDPSCSQYTLHCVREFGAFKGMLIGAKRIARCHPFNAGGYDPPPCDSHNARKLALTLLFLAGSFFISHGVLAQAGVQKHEIRTKEFVARFASKGGGLESFKLLEKQFIVKGRPIELVSTDKPAFRDLSFSLEGVLPVDAQWSITAAPGVTNALEMVWQGQGLKVIRKVQAGKSAYQLWMTTRIINTSKSEKTVKPIVHVFHYVPRSAEKGGFFASRAPAISHGLCLHQGSVERLDREKLAARHRFSGKVGYAAIENQYFVSALALADSNKAACTLVSSDRGGTSDDPAGTLFAAALNYQDIKLAASGSTSIRTMSFLGPKKNAALLSAGHRLHTVVDLGFFSVIGRALVDLLALIHRYVGNWGVAIILLTLLVKLALYPLTEKSFQSMAKLRLLKPELDRINELYENSREKKGAAMMELYRRHKINPMGGCLPQLMQLPIWWALYSSLSTNIELYNAPFVGWWSNLSAPDPYFVLPAMLGGLMVVQQRITPTTMDPAQAKMMMYFMPAFLTAVMLFLPSGLCLYMATNQVLSLVQQKFIDMRITRKGNALVVLPATSGGGAGANTPKQRV